MPSLESGDHEKPPKDDEAKEGSKEKQSTSSETVQEFIRRILTGVIENAMLTEEEKKKLPSNSIAMPEMQPREPRCDWIFSTSFYYTPTFASFMRW